VIELWRGDVRAGRRDCVPSEARMQRVLAGFDWASGSRIVEGADRTIDGAVLVSNRATPLGPLALVEVSAAGDRPEVLRDLVRWGLGLSRAAGAAAAQVWRGHSDGGELDGLGLERVRPWWRMDRLLELEPPAPVPVNGYQLLDARAVPAGAWSDVHNRAFQDHWRFSPRTEEELMGRQLRLSLMAATPDGSPAALTICHIEAYSADLRPQPVGIVTSVGTLPGHRRHGLATWLVAESLVRLQRGGARHASLYVDGLNPMRAFDAYRKLGFEVAFETEVWEATFR
jgi:ribosomal protein S18 acetylase RimI-like enzyme